MMSIITKSPEKNTCLFPRAGTNNSFVQNDGGCILDELIKEGAERHYPKINTFQKKNAGPIENLINEMTFEFKTSLANISLASEILETSQLSEEQEKMVAIILRGSNRISSLLSGFKFTSLKDRLQTELLRLDME
jgi:signal transduction histidine kinase